MTETKRMFPARAALALGVWVAYALAFIPLYHVVGSTAASFAMLPAAVTGWLFGIWPGLLAGAGAVLADVLLATVVGEVGWVVMFRTGLPGAILLVASGLAIKRLRESAELVKRQLTQSEQAEQEIRGSEERFRTLFEFAPDAYYLSDLKGNFLDGNKAAERMVGYRREELIGKSFLKLKLLPANQIPKAGALLARNVLGQPTGPDELALVRTDGTRVPVEIRTVPIELDGQRVVLGIARDITERKRAQEALAGERNLLRTLMDTLPDYVFVKDAESRFITTNAAHLRLLGAKSREEVVGKTDYDLFPRELAEGYFADEQEVIRSGRPLINREEFTIRPDGQKRWLLTTKVPLLGPDATPAGLVGISRDITERKRAEEALAEERNTLRTLIDNLPGGIYVKDTESRFILGNRAVARLMGAAAPDELVGKTDFDFYPRDLAARYYADEQEIIRSGQPLLEREEPLMDQMTGKRGWLLTTKVPLGDAEGQIVGLVGIGRDITERKRAEEQLRRYADELEQRNREIRDFAYVVSHDFRAPLVNLKGFSAELRSALQVIDTAMPTVQPHLDEIQRKAVATALKEDVPEALGFIESSVTRMDKYISAVLKLSRLGRRELVFQPLDVEAIVRGALGGLAHQIAERQVEAVVGSLPEVVADRTSMEQIMGNLLSNAVKYLEPHRPGKIEILGERRDGEAVFQIRDNGRGIAAEDMDKVFMPFRRVGRQDIPGEGMGLSYVRTMVRRHGGQIRCDSELGTGTLFTFAISDHVTEADDA